MFYCDVFNFVCFIILCCVLLCWQYQQRQQISGREQLGDIPTAGELLGRTHEELVLLLIQLRRRHTATHRAIEQCCAQINSIKVFKSLIFFNPLYLLKKHFIYIILFLNINIWRVYCNFRISMNSCSMSRIVEIFRIFYTYILLMYPSRIALLP